MIIVINGASRGIGKDIFVYLWNHFDTDSTYILLGRSLETNFNFMNNAWTMRCDSTCKKQVKKAIQKVYNTYGRIDVLINVAGSLKLNSIIDETEEQMDRLYESNVKTHWYFIKEVLPIMRKQKNGYIINISSMQAKRVFKNKSSYAMSKAAINSLTEAINREHNGDGIRATAICPGFVHTEMVKGLTTSTETLLDTKDISKTVHYLLSLSKVPIINEILIERKLW